RTTKMRIPLSGFTMAEILLSLTIIGVVAAITLPSLTGNINERTWNTQRKALFARMSQAVSLMGAINDYSDSETFVTAGLSKVLKINNICSPDKVFDCGMASKISKLTASTVDLPRKWSDLNAGLVSVGESVFLADTEAAAFETQNGESILAFYNPRCVSSMNEEGSIRHTQGTPFYMQNKVCVNLLFDLNGKKGPNTLNKDIGFITIFSPSDSIVVAPFVHTRDTENVSWRETSKACTKLDNEYRVPTKQELWAMFVNNGLLGLSAQDYNESAAVYWSSTSAGMSTDGVTPLAWAQGMDDGRYTLRGQNVDMAVRCVKR
ncbi:MAG: prepilin-type N-terminal cleavage/methylation domain-containing protein, partial [Fusobacterium sp.]|nr:prepilin-type N-terminal cleavage/methylation domain-containing protein [Fusobacterium sp.]